VKCLHHPHGRRRQPQKNKYDWNRHQPEYYHFCLVGDRHHDALLYIVSRCAHGSIECNNDVHVANRNNYNSCPHRYDGQHEQQYIAPNPAETRRTAAFKELLPDIVVSICIHPYYHAAIVREYHEVINFMALFV
jgi:hypothetical protein